MDENTTNEVSMPLELLYFLHGVVIEHSNVKIITSARNPLAAYDKPDGSYGESWCLDSSDAGLMYYSASTLLE